MPKNKIIAQKYSLDLSLKVYQKFSRKIRKAGLTEKDYLEDVILLFNEYGHIEDIIKQNNGLIKKYSEHTNKLIHTMENLKQSLECILTLKNYLKRSISFLENINIRFDELDEKEVMEAIEMIKFVKEMKNINLKNY